MFTGTVTLNAGAFRHVRPADRASDGGAHVHGKTLTFRFADSGGLDGVLFATSPADTSIIFTLRIGGHPATATQIRLGGAHTRARRGSPLTLRR